MENEKQYYWVDLESGVRYPCTKEYHDSMMKAWKEAYPPNLPPLSTSLTPIITGTPSGKNNFDKYIAGCDPYTADDDPSKISIIPLKAECKEYRQPTEEELLKHMSDACGVPSHMLGDKESDSKVE